ncbi:MAG TPA: TetR/AcrR family transcriptional regulator [Ramlibacter sp.]|nr:TetR/AcrR family transcriptional regulator [Ramlibacter sp.]
MARPGRNIEQALLKSGRKLYAQRGASGLAVRALTEHARVNLGMFHYHFRTKDEFLRQLLSGWYEEMFGALASHARQDGPPLHRLQDALLFLARFARDNRPILSRVLMDAASGNAVAAQFLRDNAPRHLALLLALMDEAERDGLVIKMPPMQRFAFVMGAVGMPILIAPALQSIGVAPRLLGAQLQVQVLGDEAIAQRIALVMKAIATGKGWT